MARISAKAHHLFSSKIYLPLSRLGRLARPSRRGVMTAFYEGVRFRRDSASWSYDRKSEWVIDRLRFVARRAFNETEYYRQLFTEIGFDPRADFGFEDFARLPSLEREDVHREGKRLTSRAIPTEQLKKDSTGGSTGAPTEIWLGPEERGWRESAIETFMRRADVPTSTRTALLWGHNLDPVKSEGLRDRLYSFANNVRWFDCFRLSAEKLDKYHEEFERWQPSLILAYASALGHLAERLLERGLVPNYPTTCLVTGAEKLLPHHRRAIELAFRRPVRERYGARDVGSVGFQTDPAHTLDYEIDWANLLVEPETAEPDSPILITKLHADAMPMLRYRIGDIGRFPEGSRPGRPTFRLREVLGREVDRIWLPGGRWIHGVQVPHLMKDYPVREFMLLQRPDYSVEIKIVPKSRFGDDSRRGILETARANLPGLDITINLVDEIPRTGANKLRPVVSEVRSEIKPARKAFV